MSSSSQIKQVSLLGATGSIGESTLDVIRHNQDKFSLFAAASLQNEDKMFELICEFKPHLVALYDEKAAFRLKTKIKDFLTSHALSKQEKYIEQSELNSFALISLEDKLNALRNVNVLSGEAGVLELASAQESDIVVGAIVGAAGLPPLLEAIKKGKQICLANKEALVMTGQYFFDEAKRYNSTILPVDSEHSAIFQCLPEALQAQMGTCDLKAHGVHQILLTGSGGPFRTVSLESLHNVTPEMAINHPVWSMGPKISVDSATMMNKALEFIEARYLFNAPFDLVKVVIHPQSVIHSMVSYIDGAVLAQLGRPSMKTPIARAMAFPKRIEANVAPLDFTKIQELTFFEAEPQRYPCLYLGMQASKMGQAATTVLNASNEVAVASFLDKRLSFLGIAQVVEESLNKLAHLPAYDLASIMELDQQARNVCHKIIENNTKS